MSTDDQAVYELGQFVQSGAAATLPQEGLKALWRRSVDLTPMSPTVDVRSGI